MVANAGNEPERTAAVLERRFARDDRPPARANHQCGQRSGHPQHPEVLADEVRQYGISLFAIQPGTVRTAMAEELLQSEAGKRWLPWLQKIFDEGRDDPPEAGAELVLYLASGAADVLSGRFFAAPGSPADIDSHADEILKRDLNMLRMRFLS